MGNHQTQPSSIIQASDGGHVFVGAWNESSSKALFNQKFWIVKVSESQPSAAPQPNSFFSNSALEWAILVIVLIAVAVLAAVIWKRLAKSPKARVFPI